MIKAMHAGALACMLLLAGCAHDPAKEEQAIYERFGEAAPTAEKPNLEDSKKTAAAILERELKDYESARIKYGEDFRWSYVSISFTKTEYGWSLPVLVNAKNSFAAYTGFRTHYIYFGASGPRDITGMIERRLAGVP